MHAGLHKLRALPWPLSRASRRVARKVRERRQQSPRPRQQGRLEGFGHTDPRLITSRAKESASASKVLQVVWAERHNPELNLISVSAAWKRLTEVERSITKDVTGRDSMSMFLNLTQCLLEKPFVEARAAANIFWAMAKLQGCMSMQLKVLKTSLRNAIMITTKQMNAQEVSNVIWAVEKHMRKILATTKAYWLCCLCWQGGCQP